MWDLTVSVPDHCLSFYSVDGHFCHELMINMQQNGSIHVSTPNNNNDA